MRLLLTIMTCFGWLFFSPAIAQEAMKLPVDKALMTIETGAGTTYFSVEIASTPQELSRGLMYRTDFPEDRAMVFIFERTHFPTMWMKNTPTPLDMLFVDEKCKIVSIFTNTQPFSEETISSPAPAAYVIEINAGAAQTNGIKEGDRVFHPSICSND